MRELEYKRFSEETHVRGQKSGQRFSCQFELTFACGLHCRHCYSDCYNRPEFIKKELDTARIKSLINKIRKQGVIWLCFSGGDPLIRRDFGEIYAYAKQKGFIVTVFTNGYSLNREILGIFKRLPPFVIELTLNAVEKNLYERISGVKGSFQRVMAAVGILREEKLPLKIKTMVTRDNIGHVGKIKKFLARQGLGFYPDFHLFARLNGDSAPCDLRVLPAVLLRQKRSRPEITEVCSGEIPAIIKQNELFQCAVRESDGFRVDPYGNLFLCHGLRDYGYSVNILKQPITGVFHKLISLISERKFLTDSRCAACPVRAGCLNCPGRAYLEAGDMESPSEYYCELMKMSGIVKG